MADFGSSDSYNRYSMPVTRSRTGLYGSDLDQTGTARFLFGEEDASGDSKYGQGNGDDNFPTLVRRDDQMVSDISSSSSVPILSYYPTRQACEWPIFGRLRKPTCFPR